MYDDVYRRRRIPIDTFDVLTACSDQDNTFAFASRAGKVELVNNFDRACTAMVSELWDGRLSEQGEGLEGSSYF